MSKPIHDTDKEEFDRVSQTIKQLEDNEFEVKATKWRESADLGRKDITARIDHMSHVLIAAKGYDSLLKAYASITDIPIEQNSKRDDFEAFKKMSSHLDEMSKQDIIVRRANPTEIKDIANRLATELEQNGEIILNDSIDLHHAASKYIKDQDGQYYKISYNAGYGASQPGNSDLSYVQTIPVGEVYGVSKQRINSNNIDDIRAIIEAQLLQKQRNEKLETPAETLLSAPMSKSTITSAQRSNTCSTRSIREMLRDGLPPDHFRNLYDLVTNTSYEDLHAALVAKQQSIAEKLGISNPTPKKTNDISSEVQKQNYQLALQYAINDALKLQKETVIKNPEHFNDIQDILQDSISICPDDKCKEFMIKKLAQTLVAEKIITKENTSNSLIANPDLLTQATLGTIVQYAREGHVEESRKIMMNVISQSIANTIHTTNLNNMDYIHTIDPNMRLHEAMNISRAIQQMRTISSEKELQAELYKTLSNSLDEKTLLTIEVTPFIAQHLQEAIVKNIQDLNPTFFYKTKDSISSHISKNMTEISRSLKEKCLQDLEIQSKFTKDTKQTNIPVGKIQFNDAEEENSLPNYTQEQHKEFKKILNQPENETIKNIIETAITELNLHEGKIDKADSTTLNAGLAVFKFSPEMQIDPLIISRTSGTIKTYADQGMDMSSEYVKHFKDAITISRQNNLKKELDVVRSEFQNYDKTSRHQKDRVIQDIKSKVSLTPHSKHRGIGGY